MSKPMTNAEYMEMLKTQTPEQKEAASKIDQLNQVASQRDANAAAQMGLVKDYHTREKESGGHRSRTYPGTE